MRRSRRETADLWDETDAVLITYGDMVRAADGDSHALAAQKQWLLDAGMGDRLSAVHLLPHFPYSSDDGFSVIDYRAVDPAVGDWGDVAALGEHFDLAFDYVLNHCSAESDWFRTSCENEEPQRDWFITEDPGDPRLTEVTRPRTHPLLTPFETAAGTRHVWTTFSADQVDLNFAKPTVWSRCSTCCWVTRRRAPGSCGWTRSRTSGSDSARPASTCRRRTRS